ncbi:MAG: carbamoyl-phosphate synthase large subunit [Rickettsiaceae bacterium]
MPKRNDIKSVLIIGSGPIIIGQSCEFDYSGSQACKALKEEGYKVILHNFNPATIMTDRQMSDITYFEPMNIEVVEKIIKKERPDTVLTTMGGQTALNLSLDIYKNGLDKKYQLELIGAKGESIIKAEDRKIFRDIVNKLGYKMPNSEDASSIEEAMEILDKFGLPCIIRDSFSLGGNRSGIANTAEEFIDLCKNIFAQGTLAKVTIDQSVIGFKEFELEVVRDHADNCIIICSIENLNPAGVHTGDSITIAPAQTLTDREYQHMRRIAFDVMREIDIDTGGANIQFALNPLNDEVFIIEVNPRVSRSSALASKATGFPIAKIAAKLSVGYTLDELKNDISNFQIPSSFEPTIDYVVTKIPKFEFNKFPSSSKVLGTQMKSVGEVMGIGRSFNESFQKAIQSLEEEQLGLYNNIQSNSVNDLKVIDPDLVPKIFSVLRNNNVSITEINKITNIDPWFLNQFRELIKLEKITQNQKINDIDVLLMSTLKKNGFSDFYISELTRSLESNVRERRLDLGVLPTYKRVDSCGGEFETSTSYLYSSYEEECESNISNKKKIIILGSGPNRIGQGLEFDYSCTHSALQLKKIGFEVIMINSNPGTVSTDFNISSKLYFEPLTFEHVYEIVRKEKPQGIIYQFGGQTPLKLIKQLEDVGENLLGPSYEAINITEKRNLFQEFLSKQKIPNFLSTTLESYDENIFSNIDYPVILRPSYVLGGKAIKVVYNTEELINYIKENHINFKHTKLFVEEFIEFAIELDVDLIYDGKDVLFGGIMEHLEYAGIHSGDSIAILPSYSIPESIINRIKDYSTRIMKGLNAIGPANIQFMVKDNKVYVIEVNLRSSRTVPFLSKSTNMNLPGIATLCLIGQDFKQQKVNTKFNSQKLENFFVKVPIFSFNKFSSLDSFLGPEMKSTGEAMCIGNTLEDAIVKSFQAYNIFLSATTKIIFYNIPIGLFTQLVEKLLKYRNFEKVYVLEHNQELVKKITSLYPGYIDKEICITTDYLDAEIFVNISDDSNDTSYLNNITDTDPIVISLREKCLYEISSTRIIELISEIQFNKEREIISIQEIC